MMPWVWLDGKIVLARDARLPCCSEGVLFGQGLFETVRSYGGKAFALRPHIARLRQSCALFEMAPLPAKEAGRAVALVLQKNKCLDAAVRLNLAKDGPRTHFFVFARKPDLPSSDHYAKGFSAGLNLTERIGATSLDSVKSFNHFFYQRLARAAKKEGFDEIFFVNARGELVEGSRTNVFYVKKGVVATPAIASGCLPGVTRAIVGGLLKTMRIKIEERRVLPGELFSADEVFATNSLFEVIAVTRLNRRRIGAGQPGPITRQLAASYRRLVESALVKP